MALKLLLRYVLLSLFVFSISFAGSWLIGGTGSNKNLLPGGDDDKPAEQVYKNIKVLNGMPAKDLHTVMHFISASLGVRCSFCHVHDDKSKQWVWDSDDKDEKATARKMIQMVKGINKDYFEGFSAVSCFTCHQGHNFVSRIPPLPQMFAGPMKEGKDTTLPKAETIIDNYNKALGDVSKMKNASSRVSKGTLIGFGGKTFDLSIYQQASNKFLQVVKTPEGEDMLCYDGTAGWEKGAHGTEDLEGADLMQVKQYADFTGDFDLTGRYSKIQTAGKDTINGRQVYVVRANIDEDLSERLYFDSETGLLLRRNINRKTMIGYIPERIDYSDYRSVEGVMIPFSVHYSYIDPGDETERKYTEVKLNASLDNISFAKPK